MNLEPLKKRRGVKLQTTFLWRFLHFLGQQKSGLKVFLVCFLRLYNPWPEDEVNLEVYRR